MSSASVGLPLIGRDVALTRLVQLAGVDPPASRTVLVSGDAGIGKSRLLAALVERATVRGWQVLLGHCLDLGGSPVAYLPFREVGAAVAERSPVEAAALTRRWPGLRRLVPVASPDAGDLPPEPVDRGAFFEAVHAAFLELARTRPLLVVVEDVHWADQSTLDLLSLLFARGFSRTVSFAASYRSDDLHRRHPLRPVVTGWVRLPAVERLELDPLPDAAVGQLADALHPDPLTPAERAAVIRRAEGNALFTEELVAALGTRTMPEDLAGLLLARLDRLEPDARLVVRTAAVGGRLIEDAGLERVSGLGRSRFEAGVRAAVDAHVLVPEGFGYRFRHSLLAEAVYDDVLPGERRRLHQGYVEVLEGSSATGTAAALARHGLGAEDHAVAFAASVAAGDEALAVGGPDEAARHLGVALDLLDAGRVDLGSGPTSIDLIGLTERASAAAAAAGLVRRAEAIVSAQLERLPATAPPSDRARLLIALAQAAAISDVPVDELRVTSEAVGLVPADPPSALRARAVAAYAWALAADRHDDDAVRWAEEGLALPPELRPGEVTAQLQEVLARVSERAGDPSESLRMLSRLAEEAQRVADPAEVRILHQLGMIQLERGDLADALVTFRSGAERSRELGRPYAPYGLDSRMLAGMTAYQLGHWDLALRLVDQRGQDPPELAAAGLLAVTLAVRAGRGEADGLDDLLARVRSQWATDGVVGILSAAAAIDLRGDAGDLDGAVAVHDEVVDAVAASWGTRTFQARIRLSALLLGQLASAIPSNAMGARLDLAAGLADVAEHATALGRRAEVGVESLAWLERARAEHLRLRRYAGEDVDPGRLVEAWTRSVEAFAGYGHPFEQARSQARLAQALRASGDGRGAAAAAEEARSTAHLLGAGPLLAELQTLAPSRSADGLQVLTPREAEVLGLVAQGRSNAQIGRELFISAKTASVHVSNILAKLSAHSRTEAVALARRRGLIA